ncbi:hypothetical protein DY000_02045880 [Brassica cretica]|uniref:HSF-type DNA-binding domain-containing protein n=1 Tax=Brassica cretica TaxID=69181 RepID=A0ABQ7ENZ4_BRACR|nr:hypothetical protein DY000_02045880 [Brassica cretica]
MKSDYEQFLVIDEAIKSVVEPEVNQAVQTGHLGDTSDRGTLDHSEDIHDVHSCTSIQMIMRILSTISFSYLDAFTPFTCKESLHQFMAKEQWPYFSSKPFRDISGRLLDRGYTQKLIRYKGSTSFLLAQEQIKPKGYIPWNHQTPQHLDLSRLFSIKSCGVPNPPSHPFHSLPSLRVIHIQQAFTPSHPLRSSFDQADSIISSIYLSCFILIIISISFVLHLFQIGYDHASALVMSIVSLLEGMVLHTSNSLSLKFMVQPETHQTSQTDHLGDTSDRRSVQGAYLDNQKDFFYENNSPRRLTHQGVIEAWNFKRIFTDKRVMNFKSQRFLSPSI